MEYLGIGFNRAVCILLVFYNGKKKSFVNVCTFVYNINFYLFIILLTLYLLVTSTRLFIVHYIVLNKKV